MQTTRDVVFSHADEGQLMKLAERTESPALERLARGRHPFHGGQLDNEQLQQDWTSTILMDTYRRSGDQQAIAMLFEIHRATFLRAIRYELSRQRHGVDADDVLQEVFVNICRYPDRFRVDRPHAFRCWSYRILYNTIKSTARVERRQPVKVADSDELQALVEDTGLPASDESATNRESAPMVDRAYLLLLQAYLLAFSRLRERDQELLTMVEIHARPYRYIAEELGVAVATVKVRVFRCRRRVAQNVDSLLASLTANAA